METVPCYNCGVSDATEYAIENGYSLKKCTGCGLLYVSPRPSTEEILEAHKLGQHRGNKTLQTTGYYDFSKVSSYVRTLRDLFGDGRELHGKKWLDIGCGYGEFLQALKTFTGNRVIARGLEPNVLKADAARKKGLDVSFFELAEHTEHYEYVSLLNVYSHLPNPPAAIAEWKQLLVHDGQLVLETGDTATMSPELHPKPYYLPDHLSFASEGIVVAVLERAGFEILAVHKYPEVRETPLAVFREALKLFVPGKHSRIGRVLKGDLERIDMYVHARRKPEPVDRAGTHHERCRRPMKQKVVILQYRLLHYRVRLFELLRERCQERDIQLHLVHGQATGREAGKQDTGHIDWADVVRNRYVDVGGKDVLWQPFPSHLRDAGLVVMMQENRLISNYLLLFGLRGKERRVAYWGHGRNFQSGAPNGVRERWKRLLVGRVDWWFAYTGRTRDILLADGYPDERITVLNNAIDNEEFERDLAAVSAAQTQALKREIGASDDAPIGLYCGSLYPDKRLDYMIAAADLIHDALPEFRLVVIGDGPSADVVRGASPTRPWMRWLGALKGREKAAWFSVADLIINPGAVGLHVLDAFCSGAPMVTTREAKHGPEIAYVEDGVNGLIVPGDASSYAHAVTALLRDRSKLEALRRRALADARRYTLDNMVARFTAGIERGLATPRKST